MSLDMARISLRTLFVNFVGRPRPWEHSQAVRSLRSQGCAGRTASSVNQLEAKAGDSLRNF